MRREVILEVEHPKQSGLLEYRQTEHRPRAVLANIVIGREWVLGRSIVQQNAFLGPQGVAEDRLWQIRRGYTRLPQLNFHLVIVRGNLGFHPIVRTARNNQ